MHDPIRRLIRTLFLGACVACASTSALAQGNVELHRFSIVPDPAGGGLQIVTAHWTVDVLPGTAPIDMSTEVELFVDGVSVQTIVELVTVDTDNAGVCGTAPDCVATCGTGTHNTQSITLDCFQDCDVAGCVCDCGVWIHTPFDPTSITEGQEVDVLLKKVPGTAPDNDSSDNGLGAPYDGVPFGWNREPKAMNFVEVAPDIYDVDVTIGLTWEGLEGRLELGTSAALLVNGMGVAEDASPVVATQSATQGCLNGVCGSPCGTLDGEATACHPYVVWPCGCGANATAHFDDVLILPGDLVEVLLLPAPGALPELPGLDGDDGLETLCCAPLSVGPVAPVRPVPRLEPNAPNPFNPRTAITFEIRESGRARLEVFAPDGRRVRTLLDAPLVPGRHTVAWDGRDDRGVERSSGTYFYTLRAPSGSVTRRMTLVR